MPPHPDAIADCVLNTFNTLPTKFKPRSLVNGRREWVPLAGIVLSRDHAQPPSPAPSLTCAALATGMKCLPQNKLEFAKGNVLHDWHAEVLAIRAFNRFLIDECADLAARGLGSVSQWVRWRRRGGDLNLCASDEEMREQGLDEATQPFALQDDVRIHMYCSEAPCGDASMELTMAEQEDATPWSQPAPTTAPTTTTMLGRGNFDRLGIVRRKPARPDAPVTLSKSCSDKLALKQCTGLLSAVTSKLLWPGDVYLSTLVLPEEQIVPEAVERAFGQRGRMKRVLEAEKRWWGSGYRFRAFEVRGTRRRFEYAKRGLDGGGTSAALGVPSNLSALYTPLRQEILINGVLQGRKQGDPRGASCVSRRGMWEAVAELAGVGREGSYAEMKAGGCERREGVKKDVVELALKGWERNSGDEEWGLDDVDG